MDPLIGQAIGSYEVVRMLGEGGMGAVYEIRHPGIGKRLALKLLHAEFGQKPDIVRRFFDEARSVNVIGHPNIVDILDFNSLPDGRPYLMMEYLEGEDLTALMRRSGAMSTEATIEILTPVCSALEAAHAVGITHRDLKPDNLFIESRGTSRRVVVLDFGIAKLSPELAEGGHTATGVLLGTPLYMAPEQAMGQSRGIGPWTDVYALGCIAYHMLSGHPPFAATSLAELISKQAYEEPVPLTSHRPDVPAGMSAAIMRALRKDPAQRFADAGQLMASLTAASSAPTVMGSTLTARSLAPSASPLASAPLAQQTPTAAASPRALSAPAPVRAAAAASTPAPATRSARWVIPSISIAMLVGSAIAVYLILTT